ncbi:amidohydrolase family protein [Streptomyces sp. NPDC052012]|uniref:metal-dependent hydrolase family protein n=1 Tax=Streptomyces sp. NPDC052012 TaxID=3155051 RepID=UPI003450BC27
MDTIVSAGRVLLGPAGHHITDGAVVIHNGVITDVGPRKDIEARTPRGITSLAYPHGTLLPGLIDTHVHLALDAGPDPVSALDEVDDTALSSAMAQRATQLLDVGITTARDLGDRNGLVFRLRNDIASGRLVGPRILAAGTPVTAPGGHCWFFGGEADGADAIRATVRRNVERGADVIKVMATGGGITKGGPPIWAAQFTAAELDIVVEEARRAGLPVAAHAHGTPGIAAAVAAGVNTIEHCTWIARDGFDIREDLISTMAANGIAVCPAASPDWRGFAQRFGPERADIMFGTLRRMREQGVRLIAGTDAGVSRAVFNDFVSSLEFFEHIGCTPAEIIDLATSGAAQALGIRHITGALQPGLDADLLVVNGNPLNDLQALRSIRLVLRGGRPRVPER